MRTDSKQVAGLLLDAGVLAFSSREPYRFASGMLSPVYMNCRRVQYHSHPWEDIGQALVELESECAQDFVGRATIAGVAVGALPFSILLAVRLHRPHVCVRKAEKDHGIVSRIDGGDLTGHRVFLVEDVVTTGTSSLAAVEILREAGATVEDCIAVVSYGRSAALDAFERAGVTLRSLTTFTTLLDAAHAREGEYSKEDIEQSRQWYENPEKWAREHALAS